MRIYQLTVVLQADMDDESRDQVIEKLINDIPKLEGDDVPEPVIDRWGRRQLAYPINKTNEGYYIMIETPMDATGISEFERNLTYVEQILRHLVVLKEG